MICYKWVILLRGNRKIEIFKKLNTTCRAKWRGRWCRAPVNRASNKCCYLNSAPWSSDLRLRLRRSVKRTVAARRRESPSRLSLRNSIALTPPTEVFYSTIRLLFLLWATSWYINSPHSATPHSFRKGLLKIHLSSFKVSSRIILQHLIPLKYFLFSPKSWRFVFQHSLENFLDYPDSSDFWVSSFYLFLFLFNHLMTLLWILLKILH